MRRLHPSPTADVGADELYGAVDRTPHPDGRPWVGVCMVASLDGSTVVDGASAALSNRNDHEVLLALRRAADVIIVGAGTVRAEGYGPPSKPGQRIGVVTGTGDVDVDTPLFETGAGFIVCAQRTDVPSGVDVVRAGTEEVDLVAALGHLVELVPGTRFVQAEGGSRLNAALAAADVVDELDLTVSPRLVGGDGPRLTTSGEPTLRDFDLAHLAVDDESFLFSRWVRRRAC